MVDYIAKRAEAGREAPRGGLEDIDCQGLIHGVTRIPAARRDPFAIR